MGCTGERMTLEEEKKLVAEKLMGWKIDPLLDNNHCYFIKLNGDSKYSYNWKPHKDRDCWPEIWEKMNEMVKCEFGNVLRDIHRERKSYGVIWWIYLTTPPELCWKALIKVLNEC